MDADVEEAGGEAPEAAVAEAGVPLLLLDVREVVAELLHGPRVGGMGAEVEDVVEEDPPHQELQREVVDPLGVRPVVRVLRQEPPLHEAVADGVGQGEVDVDVGGRVLVLRDGVHHPLREGLDDARDVEVAGHRPRDPARRAVPVRLVGESLIAAIW